MALEVGQAYESTLAVTGSDGEPANPAAATLVITLPDGTTVTPAVQLPPAVTGLLSADYVFTQAGLHKFAWTTSSPPTANTDWVTCREFVSLISRQEAKDHLNFKDATDDEEELSRFMMAATEVVQAKGGQTIRSVFTDEIRGDIAYELVVSRLPVLAVQSVTSVWPGGPSWTDPGDGSVLRVSDAGIVAQVQPFPFWWGPWRVAYSAGRAVPLERHLHAVKEQLRHLWETQRGSMGQPLLGSEEQYTTAAGFSFSVPRRVLELLEDDMLPPL